MPVGRRWGALKVEVLNWPLWGPSSRLCIWRFKG